MISNIVKASRTKCKFGIVVDKCQTDGNDILTQLGLPKLSCDTCTLGSNDSIVKLVKKTLAVYKKLSGDHQILVGSWLRAIGMVPEAEALQKRYPKQTVEIDFTCPVTKVDLVSPCKLKDCKYYVVYPWSLNCLLAYTQQQGVEQLSHEEISYLYNINISKVYEASNNSLYSLRTNAIVVARDNDSRLKPKFEYFKTMDVCCVCESVLDFAPTVTLQIPDLGLAYCSKECKQDKPVRLIELESEYGLDIATILDWAFKKFQSLSISEQALSLPRWLSYQACKKYLNKDLEEYFTSLKSIQKHRKSMLIRRTWHAPVWVDQLIYRLKSIEKTINKDYGKPTIDMRPVYSSLRYVLDNL